MSHLASPPRLVFALAFVLLANLPAAAQIPTTTAGTPTAESSPESSPEFARYHRTVTVKANTGTACAVLDPAIYTHAARGLRDLRLYPANAGAAARDLPYALTLSEPEQPESATARLLNLGFASASNSGVITFDLQMPPRPYTDVVLDLKGQNFLATASVTGSNTVSGPNSVTGPNSVSGPDSVSGPNSVSGSDTAPATGRTHLGDFTLFDLTAQHLARSTTLHLGETSFPFLHIRLAVSPLPGAPEPFVASPAMVLGAAVPPSREGQTVFTVALTTSDIQQRGNQSVAHFRLPTRLPIERVQFVLKPGFQGNFSRDVRVSAKPIGGPSESAATDETTLGAIERVNLTATGHDLRTEHLSLPATLGANLESPADVDVSVTNGNDPPLPIDRVELETRERKLCFDATTAPIAAELFYGDPALAAPQYDFARIFSPTAHPVAATLGPEVPNPNFHARPDTRSITERHPGLLWIALLLVVGLLGVVALRSPKTL